MLNNPETLIFGNTIERYSIALVLGAISFFALKLLKFIFLKYIQTIIKVLPGNNYTQVIFIIIRNISFLFYFIISIWIASQVIAVGGIAVSVLKWLVAIVLTWESIKAVQTLIHFYADLYIKNHDLQKESADITVVQTLVTFVSIAIWIIGILIFLSNLGYNVNALIASFGIGGIAVALAVQNILADIFSSLSLFLDRPFQVGDYIMAGKDSGKVEKVGLKTTKLRTLQGQLLIIPNSDLIKSRIENFHHMDRRRVEFLIGVAFTTPNKQLAKIPAIVEESVMSYPQVEFQHCFLKAFGTTSLLYEVAYTVTTRQFDTYLMAHNGINLNIKEAFEKAKIPLTPAV